jgi:3-oxoacyl-(acyl-carrier-protein) synthase
MTIAGMSWVTPLGTDIENVWQGMLAGEVAPIKTIANEQTEARYLVQRVPVEATANLPQHPRLRRASAISRFAAAAGLAALKNSRVDSSRLAIVFANSNGGVVYTRRFYSEIVRAGAQSASPLLFPETVFNAPASHLAAILGITGASYTVVGDGAVGVLALKLAEDLLASSDLDACLVVGAEEIDPLVCEAYRQWRLLRDPNRPESERGMIVSEGAGAVLLQRSDPIQSSELSLRTTEEREANWGGSCQLPLQSGDDLEIEQIDAGTNFFRRSEVGGKMRRIVQHLDGSAAFCIGSANGTFIDKAEESAIEGRIPRYSPKIALGESVGASVFWQLIAGAQGLRTNTLPGFGRISGDRALFLACGVNQQLGGLTINLRHPERSREIPTKHFKGKATGSLDFRSG